MKRMVSENGVEISKLIESKNSKKKIDPDMRIVLGYLNQSELITNLNIGNIMQISPLSLEELLS